jgi:hypothetical protein
VAQVKKEGEGVKLGGGRTRVDIGGLVVLSPKPLARFSGLGLKTIGGQVYGFVPQNLGGGSEEEQTAHGGIEEFASRRISQEGRGGYRMKITSIGPYALGLCGSTQNI